MRCGRASVSTTRCTATDRPLSCCCRPGRSSTRASGSCRCPTSPGTPRSWCTTAAATGVRTGPPARRRTTTPSWSPTRSPSWTRSGCRKRSWSASRRERGCCWCWRPTTRTGCSGAVFAGPDVGARGPAEPHRGRLRARAGRATTAGGAGTRTTGAATRPVSPSSSSARPSRRRTRPGRWRTRWRGRSRPTRRRWSPPARHGAGSWAPPRRWPRPRRCAVRPWCCTATTTAITPLSDGVALARGASGAPIDVVVGGGHCVQARHPVWFNLRLRRFVEEVSGRASA